MARAEWARVTVLVDDRAGPRGLLGQHGLSVLIEARYRGTLYRVLFDTGQGGGVLRSNAEKLGVELRSLEAIVLSHNHYDHTGGLLEALEASGGKTPLVAHPDVFKPSLYIGERGVRLNIGVPYTRRELEEAGAHPVILVRRVLEVTPGVYFLGEVERRHPHLAPLLPGNYTVTADGELAQHPLNDDTGLAVVVEGYGALVIGGCSHSGIANIVEHASTKLGEHVRAVMGGFHMASMNEERITETVKVFKENNVEKVYPGHCTGLRAEYMLLKEIGGELIHSGYTLTLHED